MCGILFTACEKLSYEDLNILHHRGPDHQGILRRDGFSFGHVRLSIQDLSSHSNQPFYDDNNVLLFNGEIYNCNELIERFDLEADGRSDTAVLFEGLTKIGQRFLNYVNGMYAVLFYDGESLVIARDPAGVKCLYYSLGDDYLSISSEIKGLVNITNPRINEDLEATYKLLRFIPAPLTAYEGVSKLKAGECISFKKEKDGNISKVNSSKIEYQGVKHNIKFAIRSQLVSDVPVAALISGGVDSSLISTALDQIKYYHATNVSGYKSEIKNVLKNKFTKECLNILTIDNLIQDKRIVNVVEEPISANSVYFLSELMANINETVIIAGQGGDELFFGYNRYRLALLYDTINYFGLSSLIKRIKFNGVLLRLQELFHFNDKIEQVALLLGASPSDLKNSTTVLSELYPDFALLNSLTLTEAIVKFDREYSLPDELLVYTDKISMLYSKEVRVPLLDLSIKRQSPMSCHGILNILFPKITLRILAASSGVFPSLKKIGFDYDIGMSKRKFQDWFWSELKCKSDANRSL